LFCSLFSYHALCGLFWCHALYWYLLANAIADIL
jgi:hypothetical protein